MAPSIKIYHHAASFTRPSQDVYNKLQPIAYSFWDQHVGKELKACTSFVIVPMVVNGTAGIYIGVPDPKSLCLPTRFNDVPLFVCHNRLKPFCIDCLDYYKDPLTPGAGIGAQDVKTQGTLGGMMLIDGEPYGLTNHHVIPPNAHVQNPSGMRMDFLSRRRGPHINDDHDLVLGVGSKFAHKGIFENGQMLDYSFIKLDDSRSITNQVLIRNGASAFCIDRLHFDLNSTDVVQALFDRNAEFGKIGATTGYTYGKLFASTPTCICYDKDWMGMSNEDSQRLNTSFEFIFEYSMSEQFAGEGDSGSIVYVDGETNKTPQEGDFSAVALVCSGTVSPPYFTIATPISSILNHFQLKFPEHQIEFPQAVGENSI